LYHPLADLQLLLDDGDGLAGIGIAVLFAFPRGLFVAVRFGVGIVLLVAGLAELLDAAIDVNSAGRIHNAHYLVHLILRRGHADDGMPAAMRLGIIVSVVIVTEEAMEETGNAAFLGLLIVAGPSGCAGLKVGLQLDGFSRNSSVLQIADYVVRSAVIFKHAHYSSIVGYLRH